MSDRNESSMPVLFTIAQHQETKIVEQLLMTAQNSTITADISVIQVSGYLDVITAGELERAVDELLSVGSYNIIIDLQHVEYVSSMGWGIFISKIHEIRSNGGDLKLAQLSPEVYEVFNVLEFHRFLNCYDTLEEAASEFCANGSQHNGLLYSKSGC